MKSLLTVVLFASVLGLGLGAVLAYVEVPATIEHQVEAQREIPVDEISALDTYPKAEVPETVYEFGSIEQGTSMSHEFVIRNVGTEPLHVEVKSTTCKCTVGDLTENDIGQNQETKVLLEWVAKTGPGSFRHGAVLSTNDPTQSTINLTVEGQVVESTSMYPSELIFGTVLVGESQTAEIFLMDFLGQDLKVLDYEFSAERVAEQMDVKITPAELNELPSPDATSGLKISATYKSGKTIGPFSSWLTLKTNIKKAEQLTIPILGTVTGDVSIFGPGWSANKGLLRMGSFAGEDGKKVTLRLAFRGKQAEEMGLEVAEVDPPLLKVSTGEPRQMSDELVHVPLVIEVPAGTAPIVRMGEPISSDAYVVLRSNDEQSPDVRVRVQFAVE